MTIKLNELEKGKLITRNSILTDNLEARIEELEISTIKHEIDPSELHAATMKVAFDEISHLIGELKANQMLLDVK